MEINAFNNMFIGYYLDLVLSQGVANYLSVKSTHSFTYTQPYKGATDYILSFNGSCLNYILFKIFEYIKLN